MPSDLPSIFARYAASSASRSVSNLRLRLQASISVALRILSSTLSGG